jgi:Predicted transcriptional regulators
MDCAALEVGAQGSQMSVRQLSITSTDLVERARVLFEELELEPMDSRIELLNEIRRELHKHSPFASEPVDCVLWVQAEDVTANDYNPNAVAPPEMKLLEHSITEDGYTQPIVAWPHNGGFEVVDGFHRHRVGRESVTVRKRVLGRLPLAVLSDSRHDRGDRIAATIRHNRARGKHQVAKMSDIVVELKRRNWNDEKIGRELGMDPDEVLRLTQITGLAEMFADQEFSTSWDLDTVDETEVKLEDEGADEDEA